MGPEGAREGQERRRAALTRAGAPPRMWRGRPRPWLGIDLGEAVAGAGLGDGRMPLAGARRLLMEELFDGHGGAPVWASSGIDMLAAMLFKRMGGGR